MNLRRLCSRTALPRLSVGASDWARSKLRNSFAIAHDLLEFRVVATPSACSHVMSCSVWGWGKAMFEPSTTLCPSSTCCMVLAQVNRLLSMREVHPLSGELRGRRSSDEARRMRGWGCELDQGRSGATPLYAKRRQGRRLNAFEHPPIDERSIGPTSDVAEKDGGCYLCWLCACDCRDSTGGDRAQSLRLQPPHGVATWQDCHCREQCRGSKSEWWSVSGHLQWKQSS